MDFEYIDRLVNDPKAIIYVRTVDGKYVWVNDTYGEELPFTREEVIGKTNRELHGDAARNWEVADSLAQITRDPMTTAEEMYDAKRKSWRKFVSTKMLVRLEGVQYIVGISVEVKDANAVLYEQRLGQLRARLIERIKEPPDAGTSTTGSSV